MKIQVYFKAVITGVIGVLVSSQVMAQESQANKISVPEKFEKPLYSPYVNESFPKEVLWGDTHVHTGLSLDARAWGATLTPEDSYRFARGEEVTSSHGEKLKLSKPLDWLVIADHSDALGVMNEVIAGNSSLLTDPKVKDWHERLNKDRKSGFEATMEIITSFINGDLPKILSDEKFSTSIWSDYVEYAEQYNTPGKFSAIIGYEWTSATGGNNLHRNVLYRDGADLAKQILPFTTAESDNPEDLWKWLQRYEDKTGGEVLALAHNGNLSNGIMFPEINPATGHELTQEYAMNRSRWEPLYEVTQIKGDGEAHPYLSPNDEFSDYGTWDRTNLGPIKKTKDMLQYEYAREALKKGLKLEQKLGINPYKFGMVGGTDTHTGLATAQENNFFGKHSGIEPHAKRLEKPVAKFGDAKVMSWEMVASGYTGVWANENTRKSIFDAMKRKEVYSTTGSRITLRFFGGWEFTNNDAYSHQLASVGYKKGVPMGGDLTKGPKSKAPTFLVSARKDPIGGNLDRIQIVKGWLDNQGSTHEQVYDVVWSDNRTQDNKGKLPPVGNTVDVKNATWSNSIGEVELNTMWIDPDFDAKQKAFYYVRVIEIPTPRWTAYDAKYYQLNLDESIPMITQERGYSSPIWYTP